MALVALHLPIKKCAASARNSIGSFGIALKPVPDRIPHDTRLGLADFSESDWFEPSLFVPGQ
jgi:hypothetical protein